MKSYIAEFIGTCALVTLGCGTAMLVGCDAAAGCGYLLTAFALLLVYDNMCSEKATNLSILRIRVPQAMLSYLEVVLTPLVLVLKKTGSKSLCSIL